MRTVLLALGVFAAFAVAQTATEVTFVDQQVLENIQKHFAGAIPK